MAKSHSANGSHLDTVIHFPRQIKKQETERETNTQAFFIKSKLELMDHNKLTGINESETKQIVLYERISR